MKKDALKAEHASSEFDETAPAFNSDTLWWTCLHAVLGFVALVLIVMASGCDGDEIDPIVDFGPQFSSIDIEDAKFAPIANMDPNAVQLGQFVHLEESEILDGGAETNVLADVGATVIEKDPFPSGYQFTLARETVTYNADGSSSTANDTFCSPTDCPSPSPSPSPSVSPSASPSGGVAQALMRLRHQVRLALPPIPNSRWTQGLEKVFTSPLQPLDDPPASNVTFHNLKTTIATVAPPDAVVARPNCAGLANCQMQMFTVTYDQVTWTNGAGAKAHFEYDLSPDAPFFAAQMSECVSELQPIDTTGDMTLVEICTPVVDFTFDSVSP